MRAGRGESRTDPARTAGERVGVAVAGRGITALTAALAVRQAVGERERIVVIGPQARGRVAHGRAFAIAAASRRLLDGLGAWALIADRAQAMTAIRITDSRVEEIVRPVLLSFAGEAAPGEPFAHMVEATDLGDALATLTRANGIEEISADIRSLGESGETVAITTRGGRRIDTALLVACDGARSFCREAAGIGWIGWDHPQTALTATLAHERDHGGEAVQHFLPTGPLALLPLTRRRSSMVWSEATSRADLLLSLPPDMQLAEIESRCGLALGHMRLEGVIEAFPLGFGLARSFATRRVALVGDAAHLVHPLAGQGLNLGFRDIAALAGILGEAARLGLRPADGDALRRYERARRFDATTMAVATEALGRLFANDLLPVRVARGLGLGIVDRLSGLKRLLVAEAAGLSGSPPRLMRAPVAGPAARRRRAGSGSSASEA